MGVCFKVGISGGEEVARDEHWELLIRRRSPEEGSSLESMIRRDVNSDPAMGTRNYVIL